MPFAAGASTDSSARIIAQLLEARWNVPVKVVNKPGGNTVPAVTEVMAARADGTTFLMDNIASSAMLDTVVKNLPYSVFDRTFVSMTTTTPLMFIVHPDSPFKTIKDAVDARRATRPTSPGPRSAASAARTWRSASSSSRPGSTSPRHAPSRSRAARRR